jgi:hypothetical protein
VLIDQVPILDLGATMEALLRVELFGQRLCRKWMAALKNEYSEEAESGTIMFRASSRYLGGYEETGTTVWRHCYESLP